jgi:hypothetical protein
MDDNLEQEASRMAAGQRCEHDGARGDSDGLSLVSMPLSGMEIGRMAFLQKGLNPVPAGQAFVIAAIEVLEEKCGNLDDFVEAPLFVCCERTGVFQFRQMFESSVRVQADGADAVKQGVLLRDSLSGERLQHGPQ